MRTTYQPNRPVRVGTEMFTTDENGNLPQEQAKQKTLPALSGMTKAELIETAEAEGVAFETDDNKPDLLAKIESSRRAFEPESKS